MSWDASGATRAGRRVRLENGEVAERSIAADCKSAALAATEVRTLPSPPTFAHECTRRLPAVALAKAGWRNSERATAGKPSFARGWRHKSRRRTVRTRNSGVTAGLPRRSAEEARSGVRREGGSNSVVESQPSKLLVAGSIPVSRSILRSLDATSFGWQASSEGCKALVVAKASREMGCAADLSAVAAKRRRPM